MPVAMHGHWWPVIGLDTYLILDVGRTEAEPALV